MASFHTLIIFSSLNHSTMIDCRIWLTVGRSPKIGFYDWESFTVLEILWKNLFRWESIRIQVLGKYQKADIYCEGK